MLFIIYIKYGCFSISRELSTPDDINIHNHHHYYWEKAVWTAAAFSLLGWHIYSPSKATLTQNTAFSMDNKKLHTKIVFQGPRFRGLGHVIQTHLFQNWSLFCINAPGLSGYLSPLSGHWKFLNKFCFSLRKTGRGVGIEPKENYGKCKFSFWNSEKLRQNFIFTQSKAPTN